MKFFLTIYAPILLSVQLSAQHVQFTGNHSLSWDECIREYRSMDESCQFARLTTFGVTDGGRPLHLFILNKDEVFYPELFDRKKTIVLVNNDIHAGEPDGVDACVMLCRELIANEGKNSSLLDSVILCIVPMYNIDGALRRSSFLRANQNGPEEYGFRANAKNLDLNRDFIKCDSRNAKSFSSMFTRLLPHVFVDTHVSNGADYPYTMTLITTQPDKLGNACGKYLRDKMEPALFDAMEKKGDKMCPYVNTMGRTPDTGIVQFLETPRFATGYAALFNTIGFTSETHMLKPFPNRVESTYRLLMSTLEYADQWASEIVRIRQEADDQLIDMQQMALSFKLDTNRVEKLMFSGYEAKTKNAEIGSGSRLYYDHKAGWEKPIPYYTHYLGDKVVDMPDYYFIPQAWTEVIERLQLNGVRMQRFSSDTVLSVGVWNILEYSSTDKPYEGHFLHHNVKAELTQMKVNMTVGDYYISTNQMTRRFLAQVLEPQSDDGYFVWNFFDSVLEQKEWFSDYVFEEKAAELLQSDHLLKLKFDEAMASDASLKNNHWNQLYWIYKNSPYYEKTVNLYPVYRFSGIMN